MSILKIHDYSKLISSKKIYPVYLFMGEESYLLDICLSKIEKLISVDSLNKEIFYTIESSTENILNALYTLPFFSKKRVVIIKDVDKMKAVDAERFLQYLSNVVETSCLILVYKNNYKKETVMQRKKLINQCISSNKFITVNCRKQYEREVKEFIKNEFAQRDKTVSLDIVTRIIDENGINLLNILNEIEKISLFVGENIKDITQENLENIGGYTKEINIYALSSNIESKDLKKAVFILERLLSEGEAPFFILSAISSIVRKMLNAKSMIEEQNMSVAETSSALKIHNFYAKAFFSNLKKHNTMTLKKSLKIILKTDISIKTGKGDVISALEKTLLFICK
jgi:DNA polymerase-3 subunit delta